MSIKTRRKKEEKRIKKELEKEQEEKVENVEEEIVVFNPRHDKEPCNRRSSGYHSR